MNLFGSLLMVLYHASAWSVLLRRLANIESYLANSNIGYQNSISQNIQSDHCLTTLTQRRRKESLMKSLADHTAKARNIFTTHDVAGTTKRNCQSTLTRMLPSVGLVTGVPKIYDALSGAGATFPTSIDGKILTPILS